ncbi:MAG: DNA ligase [Actinobacteria bacterium 13_2_20CM_2_71_6]|nr:MAG: DNA ligase [Actinobacteria bacterium 13_2_20CM_2_71_6]
MADAPMLATTGPLPAGTGWAYEFKWDGVRALASVRDGTLRLHARSGAEITVAYPEVAPLGRTLPDALLDGEIVLFNAAGKPSFTELAERMHVREAHRAARLAAARPVTYMIFDLLRLDGVDLTERPYVSRRELLDGLDLTGERWLVPPYFLDGPATLAAAREYDLEGVVAKRLSAPYRPGVRSLDWIKYKADATAEFVVGGYRPGVRTIGGLLLGVPGPDGRLLYRGRCGGGISAASERALLAALRPRISPESPFATPLPREDAKDATWVRPEVVVEIKYGQRTPDGRLRFPRFLRLRPDLSPEECVDA